jgi:hypothetical protein
VEDRNFRSRDADIEDVAVEILGLRLALADPFAQPVQITAVVAIEWLPMNQ